MPDDMSILRQVRKALNDIEESLGTYRTDKGMYQLYLLRKMIDADKPQPWSHYQPQVEEEFGNA